MNKARLASIMRRAHQVARMMTGDYQARLRYGLKVAWAEYRWETGKVQYPDLQGTEKQVAWAEDIRRRQINNIRQLVGWRFEGKDVAYVVVMEALRSKTDSRFWINNRKASPMELLAVVAKELKMVS